jgi:hypothetical protein
MILYVESNFVQEMALLQEEHDACEELLALAKSRDIQLVLPAYCIGEPYETLVRRSNRRRALHDDFQREIHELGRSRDYAAPAAEIRRAVGLLIKSGEEEKRRLDDALRAVVEVAAIIPLDGGVFTKALDLQSTWSLDSQDSFVCASVVAHLEAAPDDAKKCFATRDVDHFFRNPSVKVGLKDLGCRIVTSFRDALGYAKSAP